MTKDGAMTTRQLVERERFMIALIVVGLTLLLLLG